TSLDRPPAPLCPQFGWAARGLHRGSGVLPCADARGPSVAAGVAQPLLVRRGHVFHPERLSDYLDSRRGVRGYRKNRSRLLLSRARPAPAAGLFPRYRTGVLGGVSVRHPPCRPLLSARQGVAAAAPLHAQFVGRRARDLARRSEPLL